MSPSTKGGWLSGIPGGAGAVSLFVLSIFAYVAQTELASYVQATRGYQKSYFMLYMAHSTFLLTLPLHLLFLRHFSSNSHPIRPTLHQLRRVFYHQLTGHDHEPEEGSWPWRKTFKFVTAMSLLITLPSLTWYVAVPWTSMTSITSIYNTSALFAYVFSVLLLSSTHSWEARKLCAVALAMVGVTIVAWGGSSSTSGGEEKYEWALIGDGMALIAACLYGFYEVIYKKHFSLPALPTSTLPFALHPSLLTSLIGLFTLTILAIPIPFLHFSGLETFELPPSPGIWAAVAGVALLGVGFNASFMVLLGVWGPVTASVGNLLTIWGVALADSLIDEEHPLTLTIILGGGLVSAAFGVMVWDMVEEEKKERREGRGSIRKLAEEGGAGLEEGEGDGEREELMMGVDAREDELLDSEGSDGRERSR